MVEPVVESDGFTFERCALEIWMREHGPEQLQATLVPNMTKLWRHIQGMTNIAKSIKSDAHSAMLGMGMEMVMVMECLCSICIYRPSSIRAQYRHGDGDVFIGSQ